MPSDRILINAGGTIFHTTSTTLTSSGSRYFQALLGPTGAALPGAKRPRPCPRPNRQNNDDEISADDSNDPTPTTIFIDRDPTLFADVLFTMRSGGRLSATTAQNRSRLQDLSCEADFFIYDGLKSACSEALDGFKNALEKALRRETPPPPKPPEAWQGFLSLSGGQSRWIRLRKGQVVFIVSATLTGECGVARYNDEGESENVPGCYIKTCEKNDSGDFRLSVVRYGAMFDIAHVGLDQIHVGDKPVNIDFRQDLRLYLEGSDDTSPPRLGHVVTSTGEYGGDEMEDLDDEDEDVRYVELTQKGSGRWDVVFWAGDKEAIPNHGGGAEPVRSGAMQNRLTLNRNEEVDDGDNETQVAQLMAAMAINRNRTTAALIGLMTLWAASL